MRPTGRAVAAGIPPGFVTLLLLTLVAPAAAQPSHRRCLAPSGDDDTAALQSALESCSGAQASCTVSLCAGVFDTGILRVKGFRGTLRGAGARATVLRARPELAVNANPQGFFRDEPFGEDPWPYLLQFVEGRASIRDLGILVPAPPAGSRPTTGWAIFGSEPIYELRGVLLLTGRDPVDFDVSRVRVVAEPDPASGLGTTAFHGIEFGGLLDDAAGEEPFPVFPARGSFEMTDSVILGVLNGAPVGEITQANVRLAHNRFRSTVAVDLIDLDRSRVAIVSNRWRVSYSGVQVRQNLDGSPSRASGILVDDNQGSLTPFAAGLGDGIFFQDPFDPSRDPGGSVLWATRNRLTLGNATGEAATGITVKGANRPKLAANRLSGRAGTALEVDSTNGGLVLGNSLEGLETTVGPDVHLGSETSDCVAIVGKGDLVQDDGVNNRVIRR
jgi:hypothetical protein